MARIGKNQLVRLQQKYQTDEAIAKLYGLSRQAVHQLRKKYDILPSINKKDERNNQIILLHNNGSSVIKLAKRFKLSITQIYRIIKKI